ncbi:hypothetical protein Clacol_007268 [Clathrus columnatus]|uniref:Nucleoporin NDC1 n=1 Tax=Clathrus columnatus TaxID=1419009 RepID=A0AAV5AEF5_9AGAM|nr:hypothetical protein Clacol_007268 [Clathrus columnatus]
MSNVTPLRPFGRKEAPIPIPDPKSSYEPLLKKELGNRILSICLAFIAFIYLLYFIPSIDISRGQRLGMIGHLAATGFLTTVAFAFGALPLLILRGRTVSDKYNSLPSRGQTFLASISLARVWKTLGYFAASGFFLAWLYVSWINITEWDDSKLSVLSPTRRNIFRINERFFYLASFNASLGLVFAGRDIIRQRQVIRWPRHDDASNLHPSHNRYTPELIPYLVPCLSNNFSAGFTKYPRPILHAFGRTWSIDVPWGRLLALGLRTSFSWEFIESAFDYWASKHHAYVELAALARSSAPGAAARRTNLFTDTKTDPTLWNALSRQLLLALGQDYQCLIRRGKPTPAPVPAPPSASAANTPRTPRAPVTPLIRRPDILKPSPKSFFDPLASDSIATKNITTAVTEVTNDTAGIPKAFLATPSRPVERKVEKVVDVVKKEVAPPVLKLPRVDKTALILGALSWMEKKLPREWGVREWWTKTSIEREVRASLPDVYLDVVGVEALARLVSASLTEDNVGVVQRDISRILEAFIKILEVAESYQAELEKMIPSEDDPSFKTRDKESMRDLAQAIELVVSLIQTLRSGVGLICTTFSDRLEVYKFPPNTAQKLQVFMDCL